MLIQVWTYLTLANVDAFSWVFHLKIVPNFSYLPVGLKSFMEEYLPGGKPSRYWNLIEYGNAQHEIVYEFGHKSIF